MRIYTSDISQSHLSYIDDTHDGILCICDKCKKEIELRVDDETCPFCKENLVFYLGYNW